MQISQTVSLVYVKHPDQYEVKTVTRSDRANNIRFRGRRLIQGHPTYQVIGNIMFGHHAFI